MGNIRKRIYGILAVAEKGDRLSKVYDIVMLILIVMNVIIAIADTFTLPQTVSTVMQTVETISVAIFTIEYILNLWTCTLAFPDKTPFKAVFKYVLSFQGLVDLFSIMPYYLPYVFPINLVALKAFRMFRLLRLFKLNKYTHALSTIGAVLKAKASQLISSMLVVLFLMIVSSLIMYSAEHEAQPDVFTDAFSGLWWAVATLTTVGYGDIYPVTITGKIISAVIAILGIGLVAVPTGIITAGFSEQIAEHNSKEDDSDEKQFCPYCGKRLK